MSLNSHSNKQDNNGIASKAAIALLVRAKVIQGRLWEKGNKVVTIDEVNSDWAYIRSVVGVSTKERNWLLLQKNFYKARKRY